MAVLDPAGYAANYPGCNTLLADFDGDGDVDVDDVPQFVIRLSGC